MTQPKGIFKDGVGDIWLQNEEEHCFLQRGSRMRIKDSCFSYDYGNIFDDEECEDYAPFSFSVPKEFIE